MIVGSFMLGVEKICKMHNMCGCCSNKRSRSFNLLKAIAALALPGQPLLAREHGLLPVMNEGASCGQAAWDGS